MTTLRVCLWSGPRNVSTALMYSFAQRSDTRVVDEPLYAHYLRVSGVEHPGREAVLAAHDSNGERVVRRVVLGPCDRPVLFLKQMAHHLVGLERGFLDQTANVLLIREPSEVLRSLIRQIARPRLADTGLAVQAELFDELRRRGQDPPVLDARELLLNPRSVLERLCGRLGLAFDEAMLSWPAGPKPEDGVWASHWYQNVHRSTGFQPYRPKTEPLPEELSSLLEDCRPFYEKLHRVAVRPESEGDEPLGTASGGAPRRKVR
ncbi:MAG: sulfotransferase family protein [Thermoanaerobaculia bacterium]